ncbi:DUF5333 domain-containing protein [Tropicibacter naphthalenivorans]|uniref:DUF5333 domain-containing protein n=1 Tax=Tropicibacter naphthalenivorans TaxID=441103 RepID=A0A0P1GF53_9RHOB|nr:DUF5333 domain-containing protein [Tropicibacter naphthalenivorans]CUH80298.1 hypothetical protein TRN7648_02917 [Tropicibacter naphthalenivorans]SMC85767.1 hypothetical protein SAMN04488093_105186 [Tropicibacter naphthalenivorans]
MRLIPTAVLCVALAAPAFAKVPLRDVADIDNGLMAIAIADEIRKECDGIDARLFTALGRINDLRNKAKALGYSNAEIDAYTKSKSEKDRMRAKAESYLASKGVDADNRDQLCAFGRAEIAKGTNIGSLLK